MPEIILCRDCETGNHHHWSDDDGKIQYCGMLVDNRGDSCDCTSTAPNANVSCAWCGEPLTKHDDDCKIVLRKKVDLMRQRIAAIQRETQLGGDDALNLGTINAMCEAILNPDFAEEIGVEKTL